MKEKWWEVAVMFTHECFVVLFLLKIYTDIKIKP